MPSRKKLGESINLEIDFIPETNSNRPGTHISPLFITIHNTDNTNKGADARAHAVYVKGSHAQQRQVSWHYTVDDKRCIKHLPINEMGWHAGNRTGNSQSIGIEICMNEDIDQGAANHRAATLAAILMYDLNIPLDNVVTHQHWSNKNCPRLLLDRWHHFKEQIKDLYNSIEPRPQAIAAMFADEHLFAGHGKEEENRDKLEHPVFCRLPSVPERQLSPEIDAHRAFLVRMNDKKWVNRTVLHYYFLEAPVSWKGAANQKEAVRQAFANWKNLGIGLEFVEVNEAAEAEIRIGFDQNDGSWSYVGRDAIDFATNPKERTMNFGWDLTTDYGRDTALHEIGHALGFPHEHQNPLAGIVWDEEEVYRYFAGSPNFWPRDTTYHNIIRKISSDLVEGSQWDQDSIMHYQFPAGLILSPEGFENKPLIPEAGLSPVDIEEVRRFYPGTPEVNIELKPYLSAIVDVQPGEQLDFVIRPTETRQYTIETIGNLDTVIVLFEDINGTPTYMSGDDDSGFETNAKIVTRLIKGRTYYLRLRLYYAGATGKGAVIVW